MTGTCSDAEVIRAVQAGSLPAVADRIARDPGALPADRAWAAQAVRVCDRIGSRIEAERARITSLLATAGIAVRDQRPIGPIQRHELTLEIERSDAHGAVAVLEGDGYTRRGSWARGAERSFWATAHEVSMERTGDVTVVVRLRWSDPAPPGIVTRLLRPTAADWAMVELPAPAWWAYPALRPVRLVLERLGVRGRDHDDLEPYLATPLDLVAPLLRAAEVGEEDVLLDLGCGDGRIVIEAARSCGCRAVGVERSADLARAAADRVAGLGLADRVRIVQGDGLDVAADEVSVALLFLPMRVAARIVPVLVRTLPVGGRVWLHEQSALDQRLPSPDRSVAVLGAESLTVAHRWIARGGA